MNINNVHFIIYKFILYNNYILILLFRFFKSQHSESYNNNIKINYYLICIRPVSKVKGLVLTCRYLFLFILIIIQQNTMKLNVKKKHNIGKNKIFVIPFKEI